MLHSGPLDFEGCGSNLKVNDFWMKVDFLWNENRRFPGNWIPDDFMEIGNFSPESEVLLFFLKMGDSLIENEIQFISHHYCVILYNLYILHMLFLFGYIPFYINCDAFDV